MSDILDSKPYRIISTLSDGVNYNESGPYADYICNGEENKDRVPKNARPGSIMFVTDESKLKARIMNNDKTWSLLSIDGGSGWLPGSKLPSKDVFQTILNVYSVEKKHAITYVDDTTPPMMVGDKVCIDMRLIRDDFPECPEFLVKINDGEPIYVQATKMEPDSDYKFSTWASKDGSIAMHTEYDVDAGRKDLVFTSGVSAGDVVYIYDLRFLVSFSPNCPMYITQFDITDADNNICEIQLSDRDKLIHVVTPVQLKFDTETAGLTSVTILEDAIYIMLGYGYYDDIYSGFANEWFDGNYDIFDYAIDAEDPVFDAFLTRLGCKLPAKYNTLVELLWAKADNGWDGRCCIAI